MMKLNGKLSGIFKCNPLGRSKDTVLSANMDDVNNKNNNNSINVKGALPDAETSEFMAKTIENMQACLQCLVEIKDSNDERLHNLEATMEEMIDEHRTEMVELKAKMAVFGRDIMDMDECNKKRENRFRMAFNETKEQIEEQEDRMKGILLVISESIYNQERHLKEKGKIEQMEMEKEREEVREREREEEREKEREEEREREREEKEKEDSNKILITIDNEENDFLHIPEYVNGEIQRTTPRKYAEIIENLGAEEDTNYIKSVEEAKREIEEKLSNEFEINNEPIYAKVQKKEDRRSPVETYLIPETYLVPEKEEAKPEKKEKVKPPVKEKPKSNSKIPIRPPGLKSPSKEEEKPESKEVTRPAKHPHGTSDNKEEEIPAKKEKQDFNENTERESEEYTKHDSVEDIREATKLSKSTDTMYSVEDTKERENRRGFPEIVKVAESERNQEAYPYRGEFIIKSEDRSAYRKMAYKKKIGN